MSKLVVLLAVSCCALGCGPAAPANQKPVVVKPGDNSPEAYKAEREAQAKRDQDAQAKRGGK